MNPPSMNADSAFAARQFLELVFLANVWHEFNEWTQYWRKSTEFKKPAGRIALLDWRPNIEPENAPPIV